VPEGSIIGRSLWPIVLVLLIGYVAADFIRNPFMPSTGSAAVPAIDATLYVSATEGGSEVETIAQRAAASLQLHGRAATVKNLVGGTSRSIADFLATKEPNDTRLLVVSSATLAQLVRDRREKLVPGAAMQAQIALDELAASRPIGLLSDDPLQIGVPQNSAYITTYGLLATMRADPGEILFGVADDAFSRENMAGLVDIAGVPGNTRFTVFPSGRQATSAMELGDTGAVLATRSALAPDVRSHQVRALPWPADHEAPDTWVAVFAPPDVSTARIEAMRSAVRALDRDPRWRKRLQHEGFTPAELPAAAFPHFLSDRVAEADRLQRISEAVEAR